MRFTWRLSVVLTFGFWMVTSVQAVDQAVPDSAPLDQLLANQNGNAAPGKTLVLNPVSLENRYRLALGISYTGGQIRYQFNPRWATETRYQFGSAGSNEGGTIHSNVFGLRLYRFMPIRPRLAWYLGGEGARAQTSSRTTDYRTTGFALGAFSGVEYRILPRVAVSADIGPYMISLKEQLSGVSQTGLDFVVNTAVNVYLF
jgi:hypothetical protein